MMFRSQYSVLSVTPVQIGATIAPYKWTWIILLLQNWNFYRQKPESFPWKPRLLGRGGIPQGSAKSNKLAFQERWAVFCRLFYAGLGTSNPDESKSRKFATNCTLAEYPTRKIPCTTVSTEDPRSFQIFLIDKLRVKVARSTSMDHSRTNCSSKYWIDSFKKVNSV